MKIYVENTADAGCELLSKAGYEIHDVKEFKPSPVLDPDAWKNITSMEAVYKWHGLDNGYVPNLSGFPEFMRAYKVAEFKAQLMAAAINGAWVADWSDTNQRKHYPWWNVVADSSKISGRGLRLDVVSYGVTAALVGPRLVFESEAKVRHAVKYFTGVFEDHYFTK